MNVIAFDPGKAGGLAFFSHGLLLDVVSMPLYETQQGEEMVDGKALHFLLSSRGVTPFDLAVVERQHPRPFDAKKSIFTLGRGYAAIETVLRILEIPSVFPTPQEWQKSLLKGAVKRGDTKKASIGFVKSRYPKLDLSPYTGDSLTGICDAVCIGHYGIHELA